MSDEIRQPGNTPRVTPLNPTRGSGARKNPRKPPAKSGEENRRPRTRDDHSHQVDEYV